jgi:hypothetical protein
MIPPRPRTFFGYVLQGLAVIVCLFAAAYAADAIMHVFNASAEPPRPTGFCG